MTDKTCTACIHYPICHLITTIDNNYFVRFFGSYTELSDKLASICVQYISSAIRKD